MKVIVQRVKSAAVSNEQIHNEIGKGFCLLVGISENDTIKDVEVITQKIANARLFEDENGKLNFNIQQMGGEILSISQFTLYANVKKGNRPSFTEAMSPQDAEALYRTFNEHLEQFNIPIETGEFGTDMLVDIKNDGPVTVIYESVDGKII